MHSLSTSTLSSEKINWSHQYNVDFLTYIPGDLTHVNKYWKVQGNKAEPCSGLQSKNAMDLNVSFLRPPSSRVSHSGASTVGQGGRRHDDTCVTIQLHCCIICNSRAPCHYFGSYCSRHETVLYFSCCPGLYCLWGPWYLFPYVLFLGTCNLSKETNKNQVSNLTEFDLETQCHSKAPLLRHLQRHKKSYPLVWQMV